MRNHSPNNSVTSHNFQFQQSHFKNLESDKTVVKFSTSCVHLHMIYVTAGLPGNSIGHAACSGSHQFAQSQC